MSTTRSDHQEPAAYWEELYLYAYDILKQKEDAEDAVARTYARIYEKEHILQAIEDRKGYLFRSVRNACMDTIRDRQRRAGLFVEERDQEDGTPDGPEAKADHRLIRAEVISELWRAVENIPQKYRIIFIRHRLYGESFVSIGQALNLTPQTVSTHYSKAEDYLRIRFSGRDVVICLVLAWLLRVLYHIF